LQQQQYAAPTYTPAPARQRIPRPKFTKPPAVMKVMFWIGLVLWFGPALFFSFMQIAGNGLDNVDFTAFHDMAWMGAILCLGSLIIWAVIVAAKSG
jgi:hypothetical protein